MSPVTGPQKSVAILLLGTGLVALILGLLRVPLPVDWILGLAGVAMAAVGYLLWSFPIGPANEAVGPREVPQAAQLTEVPASPATRMEVESLKHTLRDWETTAMDYLEALHRSLDQFAAEDPRRPAIVRDAEIFVRFAAARGLHRIAPESGEPYVEGLYGIVEEESSTEIPPGSVLRCLEWGYEVRGEVRKKAIIVLAKSSARS